MHHGRWVWPLGLLPLGACDDQHAMGCLRGIPTVLVEVREAATGAPAAADAVGLVQWLGGRDTMHVSSWLILGEEQVPVELAAPPEVRGQVRVTVAKPGYATWTSPVARVVEDPCVQTVRFRADLVPTL